MASIPKMGTVDFIFGFCFMWIKIIAKTISLKIKLHVIVEKAYSFIFPCICPQ